MPLLNRLITGLVAICGISSIIGSGFCVRTFVGDNNEVVTDVEANVEVTASANTGALRLIGNLEAQQEVKAYNPEVTSINDPNAVSEDGKTLKELITMYTSRKIVFTEGNEDSNNLKDGLTFYRLKKDPDLGIRTFIRENQVRGGYAFVPKTEYDAVVNSGLKFKIGLRVSLPARDDSSISNYLELDSKYDVNNQLNPTFSIYRQDTYYTYLDLTNDFFGFEQATNINFDSYIEDFSDCYVFNFELDLQDMFSYKPGKKPNTNAKLKEIKNAIESNPSDWKITFDFITTYVN